MKDDHQISQDSIGTIEREKSDVSGAQQKLALVTMMMILQLCSLRVLDLLSILVGKKLNWSLISTRTSKWKCLGGMSPPHPRTSFDAETDPFGLFLWSLGLECLASMSHTPT